MKSIIVSGITGFMGSNLKYYLNKDYNLVGLSRQEDKTQNILSYSALNKSVLSSSYAFIHLAGKAHDLKNTTKSDEYFQVNRDLTIKLFNNFLQSDCKIFVFMSTVKALADTVDEILTEENTPGPITAYGKSKLEAEQYIISQNIPKDKLVYILRPCMVHGPNNKGNLNLLYKIINNNIPFPLGRYNNVRSFLSIDNLCFLIKELLKQQPESNTFNIADDNDLSTNDLVRLIGKVINKPAKIINSPKWLVSILASLGDILPLPLNTERLDKLTENYRVSNRKIKLTLNINLPLTANEGFEKTIKSFQNSKA